MSIQAFPEIENFQKLPHQVIVKGGGINVTPSKQVELRGIVINNIGNSIKDIKINVVIFDSKKIPIFNSSIAPNPDHLHQGGIAPFIFQLEEQYAAYTDYHLYANWNFDN